MLWLLACRAYTPVQPLAEGWQDIALDVSQQASVSVLLLGDFGKAGPELDKVSASAARVCADEGCDLAVVLGDNFYQDGVVSVEDPLWDSVFVQPWTAMADGRMRFWAAMGNHDWRANQAGAQAQIAFTQNPKNPNGLWQMPAMNYAIPGLPDWLTLHMVDTMSEVAMASRNDYLRELDLPQEGWRIVAGHHLVRSSGPHGRLRVERHAERLGRTLDDLDVDVLLSGHDHHQELLFDGHRVQVVQGNSAKARPTKPGRHQQHQRWVGPQEQTGFARMVATPDQLTFVFYDALGAELHRDAVVRTDAGLGWAP